jgi:hypothetical protein
MSGKYSSNTLRNIRVTCEELKHQFQRINSIEGLSEHFNAQQNNNNLSLDQKSAANQILQDLNTKKGRINYCISVIEESSRNLLDQNDAPGSDERKLESALNELTALLDEMQEHANSFFITNNHDNTPKFDNPTWDYFSVLHDVNGKVKSLNSVTNNNSLYIALETDNQLKGEFDHIAALTCDGSKAEDVEKDLAKYEKKLNESDKKLDEIKNARDEWKKNYYDAVDQVNSIPSQIKQYIDESDELKDQIELNTRRLTNLTSTHNTYTKNKERLDLSRKELIDLTKKVDDLTAENNQLRKNADDKLYNESKDALLKQAGNTNKQDVRKYIEDRERQLNWEKIRALSDKLYENLNNHTLGQTIVFSQVAQKAKSIFGITIQQEVKGLSAKHLQQLEEGLPTQELKNKVANARIISNQMLELAPDKARLQKLLTKLASEDEKVFFDNLYKGIEEEIKAAKNAADKNPAYVASKKLLDEEQEAKEQLKIIENQLENVQEKEKDSTLNETDKDLQEKLNLEAKLHKEELNKLKDKLTKNAEEASAKVSNHPVNVNEIDKLLSEHIHSKEALVESDEKLAMSKAEKERTQEIISDLEKEQAKIRNEVIEEYSATYRKVKENENDKAAGKGQKLSDNIKEQLANAKGQPEDQIFVDLKKQLETKIASDKDNREKVIEGNITKLNHDLNVQKKRIEEYSFKNYKKALIEAHMNNEKNKREVQHYKSLKGNLKNAMEIHNRKVKHLNAAMEAFNNEKAKILEQIKYYTTIMNLNKKTDHQNSPAFQAIENALKAFYDPEKNEDRIQNMTPEEIKQNLNNLKTVTEQYKTVKLDQKMHWFPSGQRQYRLKLADNLISFANERNGNMANMKLTSANLEIVKNASQEGLKEYTELSEFAKMADIKKQDYMNNITGFKKLVDDVKEKLDKPDIGSKNLFTDEDKTDMIKNAIIHREIKKKLYNYDSSNSSIGSHTIDLQNIKNQVTNQVNADLNSVNKNILKTIVNDAIMSSDYKEELKVSNIAYSYDADVVMKNKYSHVQNYEIVKENVKDMSKQNVISRGSMIKQ